MRVYIAGPYSIGDPAVNVKNAMDAANQLLDAGHQPYIPHLTHFLHMYHPRNISVWYELDNAWLAVSEALIRLPGVSSGAEAEVRLALKLGIPVMRLEELCE